MPTWRENEKVGGPPGSAFSRPGRILGGPPEKCGGKIPRPGGPRIRIFRLWAVPDFKGPPGTAPEFFLARQGRDRKIFARQGSRSSADGRGHVRPCAHMCAHLPMCAHFGGEGTPGTSGGPAPSRRRARDGKKFYRSEKFFFSKGAAKNFFAPRSRRRRNLAAPPPLEIFSRSLAREKNLAAQ